MKYCCPVKYLLLLMFLGILVKTKEQKKKLNSKHGIQLFLCQKNKFTGQQ